MTVGCRLIDRMKVEDRFGLPPIVLEIVGENDDRVAATVLAYHLLCLKTYGGNGDLEPKLNKLLNKKENSWLELPPESDPAGLTPLQKIRLDIEKERQKKLAKGLNPCSDISLN